jgi:hypothetical protein
MCIKLTTEREATKYRRLTSFFRVYCLLPARECLARCHKYEIYTFLINLYVMYPWKKGEKRGSMLHLIHFDQLNLKIVLSKHFIK